MISRHTYFRLEINLPPLGVLDFVSTFSVLGPPLRLFLDAKNSSNIVITGTYRTAAMSSSQKEFNTLYEAALAAAYFW